VFTDHWTFVPEDHLMKLNRRYAPFRIFGGIEVSADGEDFIVIGVRDPRLGDRNLSYDELHSVVRLHNGFIALVHPFRFSSEITADIERLRPDGIEVRSTNTPVWAEQKIRNTAARLNLPLLCNSDAHHVTALGKHYNRLNRIPADESDLIVLLRTGQFSSP
jgi:hypothetical protein